MMRRQPWMRKPTETRLILFTIHHPCKSRNKVQQALIVAFWGITR